ncbi:heat-labile enterotoxin alpha chain family protein [Paraburkholderia xenovorans LB400]|uniref:Heat-labile enterotoxin alpha chain n=1 Tax=Paraburkholderia xenovorans (strain LB400) TaxID=266265 RepID=Q13Q55_PARXL|nr:hypothetical protein Bxe_B2202 [Paraburkholderia xenovorans LB400]AIP37695.1 heat-labile enterotoxin alpha chain family protein [Paraburkholderia xenovorans LB400]
MTISAAGNRPTNFIDTDPDATRGGELTDRQTRALSFGAARTGEDEQEDPTRIQGVTSRTQNASTLAHRARPASGFASTLFRTRGTARTTHPPGAAPLRPDVARREASARSVWPGADAAANRAAASLVASGGPAEARFKRQTPPVHDSFEDTQQAYAGSAAGQNGLNVEILDSAATQPDVLDDQCAGLAWLAMHKIFEGRSLDLMGATDAVYRRLLAPSTRSSTLDEIRRLQTAYENVPPSDLPGYEMRLGRDKLTTAGALVNDLRRHFSASLPSQDGLGTAQDTFTDVTLSFGEGSHHAILIQRVNRSADYRNDEYQLYDASHGAFRYQGFDSLGTAINALYERGYRSFGGVTETWTTYYADPLTWRAYTGLAPDAYREMMQNAALHAFGNERTPVLAPTDPGQLPPPPDFDQPGPSGWDGGARTEFRRSTGEDHPDHPFALFRPSQTSPARLKEQQGFSVEDTPLRNTSLDLHDSIVAGNPAATDGGGYVGTFTGRAEAQARIDATAAKKGYVYYVAPSPNMVDVRGSLGSEHARAPRDGEVAAMGHIDYTQVRGWQKYENGKLAPYVANPDYRWDVYDATRTAGAQPQLAHFSPDNPAWADAGHRPFVTPFQQDGKTLYRPNEHPALVQARFYQHANADIQQRVKDQANRLDYRGPVTIETEWANSGAGNPARLNFTAGYPSIDRSPANGRGDRFRMGDDGRIHLASDYSKVLRIGGDGNAYIGSNPGAGSLNGVFFHDPETGAMIHVEDRKLLTEGVLAYTPYVAPPQGRSGLTARQSWTFSDSSGNKVQPPVPPATFSNSTAGSPDQLYRFYQNPDSALPDGASHFVTSVPGVTPHQGAGFLFYPDHIAQGDAAAARQWLAAHNAAWLFKDGFYAVASGPAALEVRTLGGTPVWRAQIDPATAHESYLMLQNGITTNYDTPARTWQLVLDNEKRDDSLRRHTGQNYM